MFFELPLITGAQSFSASLDGTLYDFTLLYRGGDPEGGWYLDVEKDNGEQAIRGVPVLLRTDMLSQYDYRGFGHIYAALDGESTPRRPTYEDVGGALRLYWSKFPHEVDSIF